MTGRNAYRFRLANALLGAVWTEVILADTTGITSEQMGASYRQQLVSAGWLTSTGGYVSHNAQVGQASKC